MAPRKKTEHNNLPIYIAIGIPVVLGILIAGAAMLPGLSEPARYSFVFTTYEWPTREVEVRQGKIVITDRSREETFKAANLMDPKLYVYDVTTKRSREITFSEAEALTLDPSTESPDGFTLVFGGSDTGVFEIFGGFSDRSWYLKKNGIGQKVNLVGTDMYGYNIRFLGWIISQ